MSLVQFVYTSRETGPFTYPLLRDLLDRSRANNVRDGITGCLCYGEPYFAQCLEGPADAVARTVERIYSDARHGDVRLRAFREVDERAFPDWAMRLIHFDELPADALGRRCLIASGGRPFRLDELDEPELFALMRDLAAERAAAGATG